MLKLGIIGTGAIAHQFIESCQLAGGYELTAIYSRTLDRAQTFIEPYGAITCYTKLEDFCQAPVDVVYVASPNNLHFVQTKLLIESGKHVIVEKPAFSNPQEFAAIVDLAQSNGTMVFEAARNYHETNFEHIKAFLADKTIYGATFHFSQYSSRMKNLLQGIYDNTFQSKMSGGALVDLGIYQVYAAYKLFGPPKTARYSADLLTTGVDLSGSGQLIYDHFQVSMVVRKNAHSTLPSEIYTDQGTLSLNHIQGVTTAHFQNLNGQITKLELSPLTHLMVEEAKVFQKILSQPEQYYTIYQHLLTTAQAVNQTLFTMRQDAGIIFEADYDQN